MNIAVDIDEVLADLLTQYINFLNKEYKLSLSRIQFQGYYTWATWQELKVEKHKLFERFYKSNYFQNIEPIKEALENLKVIKNNHKLFIVTSRPDYLKESTCSWIEKFFPNTFEDIFFANYLLNKKKSEVCKTINSEIIIEDNIDYANDCAINNINVIIISYPWNKHSEHSKIHRVKSWRHVPLALKQIHLSTHPPQ